MEQRCYMRFNVNAEWTDIKEINTSFAVGTLRVMYTGDNRNKSSIPRESVVDALPSLYNVPVVCHWDDQTEEIGEHDIAIVADSNGKKRIKNLTEPIGVIPDHAVFHFSIEEDENGVEHEYLVIENVILWKRQDACRHIMQNLGGKIDHSMEITVFDGETRDDGIYRIDKFEFTALCLLGNCEPCFEGSSLMIYSADEFKLKMEEMMKDLKENYQMIIASGEVDDIHPLNQKMEGGDGILDEKLNLASEYGINIETLDFSMEDYSLEELKEKFEAMNKDEEQHQFALIGNLVEEVHNVLSEKKVCTEWGERSEYYYVDCDPEKGEIYCWDTKDWKLYGFTYTLDGDKVVIDFETKKRVKYVIEDFDNGEQESPFADIFTAMETKITEGISEYETICGKYSDAEERINALNAQIDELAAFKAQVESDMFKNAQNEIFERFADKLSGIEAFESLRANCDGIDAEALEDKCYAILGRNSGAKFSAEPKPPKFVVTPEHKNGANEPYGGAFVKYGINNDNK